jgi:hypothetical protein
MHYRRLARAAILEGHRCRGSSNVKSTRCRCGRPKSTSPLSITPHALQRCVIAAGLIGGRALVVNAVDVEVVGFWRRRGFLPSRDDPFVLFRTIADTAAVISS